jgi:uncharacterized membrane protein YqjE
VVSRLLVTLLAIARTRVELAAAAIELERARLARMLLCAALALVLLQLAVAFGVGWLLLVCAPSDRPAVLGILALLVLAAGLVALRKWVWLARRRPAWALRTPPPARSDR